MGAPLVEVAEIDPRHEAAFDAWFAVLRATDMERAPDKPGWQRVERLAMALDDDGPERHRLFVARDGGGVVRGIADVELYRRENLALARVDLRVLPASRRRGIGSGLLAAVEQVVVAAGRTELGGMDETPVRVDYEDAGGPFALRHGFALVQTMVRRELRVPLSPAQARALSDNPKSRPPGYSLITFLDRWPDELVADRCELGRRMSTDVPMGAQELDEEVWDEARVRQIEAAFAAQNRAKVITVARHDDSGRLAGFTEIAVPTGRPRIGLAARHLGRARTPRARPGLRHEAGQRGRARTVVPRRTQREHVERGRERAHDRGERRNGIRGGRPLEPLAEEAQVGAGGVTNRGSAERPALFGDRTGRREGRTW
jgi:GNAT superfamily N-acetyltransferase